MTNLQIISVKLKDESFSFRKNDYRGHFLEDVISDKVVDVKGIIFPKPIIKTVTEYKITLLFKNNFKVFSLYKNKKQAEEVYKQILDSMLN